MLSDEDLKNAAIKYARSKEATNKLIEKYASLDRHSPDQKPGSIFMAGSPGAGKTEFSKNLIKELGDGVVRIDPDEVRALLPQYNGKNASLFQSPVNIGVDDLFFFALKNRQNFILDGTLAFFEKARNNILKCLETREYVEIYYLFQDPSIAWKFTQDREVEEGRRIDKEVFIRAFIASKENVQKLKSEFGEKIRLNLVVKDYNNDIGKTKLDVEQIDIHLEKFYSIEELRELIK